MRTSEYGYIRESIGESPQLNASIQSTQRLSPLENSPPDCFQFTLCPSSYKAFAPEARGRGFRRLRTATKGLLALWTPRQRGAALDPPCSGGFAALMRRFSYTFSSSDFPSAAIIVPGAGAKMSTAL